MLGRQKLATNVIIQQWIYSIIVIISLFFLPIWILYIAPALKKIPDNFTYSADILSIDNFYDEKAQKFEGEHISKTIFSYSVFVKKPKELIIKNVFDVHKLSNKPIFSVTRFYYINPYTGQHIESGVDKIRSGYLFAPHYTYKKDFTYWHINYDVPAHLKYMDDEIIDGLRVHRYQANYSADQTANLTRLPNVGITRGIKTDIILQLWIEPVSGWLVKYQDYSIANYYDLKTGKLLYPWNQFSNRYTENSVRQQVHIATFLKWKILTIDFGIPFLFISLAIFFTWLIYKKINIPNYQIFPDKEKLRIIKELFVSSFVSILFISAVTITIYYFFIYKRTITHFTIGISQWSDNPDYNEIIQGFKDGLAQSGYIDGKNLTLIIKNPNAEIEKQISIIQSFLKNHVNLIFTLTTPGTLVAKGITTRTPIVFSDVTYPKQANIITSLISSKNNLVGTRNYISPAQQFFQFNSIYPKTKFLGFVHHKGDPDSEIQFQEYKSMLNKRGIDVTEIAALDLEDLAEQLKLAHVDAFYLACDTLMQGKGGEIVAIFGRENKIATFSCNKNSVMNGALEGYVADLYTIGKIAGKKAALILDGAETDWIRTDTPQQGNLVINLKTAQQLKINIPEEKLQSANVLIGK